MNEERKLKDYCLSEYCKSGKNCKSCYLENTCKDKPNMENVKPEIEILREENNRLKEVINKIYLLIKDRN